MAKIWTLRPGLALELHDIYQCVSDIMTVEVVRDIQGYQEAQHDSKITVVAEVKGLLKGPQKVCTSMGGVYCRLDPHRGSCQPEQPPDEDAAGRLLCVEGDAGLQSAKGLWRQDQGQVHPLPPS